MSVQSPIFEYSKLATPPKDSATHLWADYVELQALSNEDHAFSAGLLEDSIEECIDFSEDQEDLDQENGDIAPKDSLSITSDQEKFSRRWADIKTCLNSRRARLKTAWPFRLDQDTIALNPLENGLQRLYIALLVSSALRCVHKKREGEVARSLEELSYHLFQKIMPPEWKVKYFSARDSHYKGNLFNKFKQLANDIQAELRIKEDTLHRNNCGDGGLDLVAWHSLGDELGNIPVAFAQCGCSPNAQHKQLEAHPAHIRRYLTTQHPSATYYFDPHDLRNNNGQWTIPPSEVILFDRARILYIAERHQLDEIATWGYIDEAINTRHPLIN